MERQVGAHRVFVYRRTPSQPNDGRGAYAHLRVRMCLHVLPRGAISRDVHVATTGNRLDELDFLLQDVKLPATVAATNGIKDEPLSQAAERLWSR